VNRWQDIDIKGKFMILKKVKEKINRWLLPYRVGKRLTSEILRCQNIPGLREVIDIAPGALALEMLKTQNLQTSGAGNSSGTVKVKNHLNRARPQVLKEYDKIQKK